MSGERRLRNPGAAKAPSATPRKPASAPMSRNVLFTRRFYRNASRRTRRENCRDRAAKCVITTDTHACLFERGLTMGARRILAISTILLGVAAAALAQPPAREQ